MLCTSLSVAGAFIVNGFYDVEKDTINTPNRVIFNRLLSTDVLLNTYVFLSGASLLIALFAGYKIFIFFAINIAIFWFYSHKLSHIPFLREISASLLGILGFVSIWLHYGAQVHWPFFVYLLAMLTVLFCREILKDLLGQKGNVIFGYRTAVSATGPLLAIRLLVVFTTIALLAAIIGFLLLGSSAGYFTIISLFGLVCSLLISLVCATSKQSSTYHISAQLLIAIMVIMVFSSLSLRFGTLPPL